VQQTQDDQRQEAPDRRDCPEERGGSGSDDGGSQGNGTAAPTAL